MATKILGIKFQVAEVKEAQARLDNLRHKLNDSLQANKQAVKESVRLNKVIGNAQSGNIKNPLKIVITCGLNEEIASEFGLLCDDLSSKGYRMIKSKGN